MEGPPSLLELAQYLISAAKSRWLSPEEVYLLLHHCPADLGLPAYTHPPLNPEDGALCVYMDGSHCKQDSINWAKKKGQTKLQETYSTLKVNGADAIKAVYCRGADNQNFRRRIYRLERSSKNSAVVHYRECPDEEKEKKAPSHPAVLYFMSQHHLSTSHASHASHGHQDSVIIRSASASIGENPAAADEMDFDQVLSDLATGGSPFPNGIQPLDAEISVLDFAPNTITASAKQRKMLICLSVQVGAYDWKVMFANGQQRVSADIEMLLPGVLRISVPYVTAGNWKLSVVNRAGETVAEESSSCFVVSPEDSSQPTLGKRNFAILSPKAVMGSDSGKFNFHAPTLSSTDTPLSMALSNLGRESFVRENKIRIVEKLGYMKSALAGEEGFEKLRSPTFLNPTTSEVGGPLHRLDSTASTSEAGSDGMEWLDDTQLSRMSNAELESVMDRYIMAVVKELVQLAAVDDELKSEMDSLDSNGYSLFHYCCLYNLTSLIPVLIARGAHINQCTTSGSTALHLAVAAGHVAVTQLLLESGADAFIVDGDGLTAYDIAVSMGREDIYPLLVQDPNQIASNSESVSTPLKSKRAASFTVTSPEGGVVEIAQSLGDSKDLSVSSRLLHDAFSSLSLTDKCALSISLSQLQTPKTIPISQTSSSSNASQPLMGRSPASGSPRLFIAKEALLSESPTDFIQPQTSSTTQVASQPQRRRDSSSSASSDPTTIERSRSDCPSAPFEDPNDDFLAMDMLSDLDTSFMDVVNGEDHDEDMSFSSHRSQQLLLPHQPHQHQLHQHMDFSSNQTVGLDIVSHGLQPSSAAYRSSEDLNDIQSVISETDKQSLDKAMSLMGHQEIIQVEEEVRKIQNNVRGWLLRKNYVNLREAARSLQFAWRERRSRGGQQHQLPYQQRAAQDRTLPDVTGSVTSSMSMVADSAHPGATSASSTSSKQECLSPDFLAIHDKMRPSPFEQSSRVGIEEQEKAAATLQAATRRMIARRSFVNLRQQTMASLTIQRNLVRWWTTGRIGGQGDHHHNSNNNDNTNHIDTHNQPQFQHAGTEITSGVSSDRYHDLQTILPQAPAYLNSPTCRT